MYIFFNSKFFFVFGLFISLNIRNHINSPVTCEQKIDLYRTYEIVWVVYIAIHYNTFNRL